MPAKLELNERAQILLKALVERYVRDGQPVGSRTLARDISPELSPATIRNVMADLEELGLITAPHTSAGRIPTALGYRFFVNSLLTVKPLNKRELLSLRSGIGEIGDADPQRILSAASSVLSEISSMAGVVTLQQTEQRSLRQIEFLPLSNHRVLAILVINEREVQNKIIHTSRAFGANELLQASNYLNAIFSGKQLEEVRQTLLRDMERAREGMDSLMLASVEMARKVFAEPSADSDLVMAGQTNLMNYAEMANVDKLRLLFEAFNQKRDILQLLDQAIRAQGIQIFIGEESGYSVLDDCSVVASPYRVDGQTVGVLGVIGPKRMAYDRVISIVDVTAKLVGSALKQAH